MPHTTILDMEEVTSPSDSQDNPNPGEIDTTSGNISGDGNSGKELNTKDFSKMADSFCKELQSISKSAKTQFPNSGSTKTTTSRRPSNPRNLMRCYSGSSLQNKSNTPAQSTNVAKRPPTSGLPQNKPRRKSSVPVTEVGQTNSKPAPRRQNSSPAGLRASTIDKHESAKLATAGQKQQGVSKSTLNNGRASPSVSGISSGRRLSPSSQAPLPPRPSNPRRSLAAPKTTSPKSTSPSRLPTARVTSTRPSKPTATVRPTRIQTADNRKSSASPTPPPSSKVSTSSEPPPPAIAMVDLNGGSTNSNSNCDKDSSQTLGRTNILVTPERVRTNNFVSPGTGTNGSENHANVSASSKADDNSTFVCTPGQHIVIPSWESGQYTIVVGANGDGALPPTEGAVAGDTIIYRNADSKDNADTTSSAQVTRNIASIVIPVKGGTSDPTPPSEQPPETGSFQTKPGVFVVPTIPKLKPSSAEVAPSKNEAQSNPSAAKSTDTRPRQHIILPIQEGTLQNDSFKIVVDPEKGVQSIFSSNGENLAVSENVNFHKNPEGGFTLTLPTALHNAMEQPTRHPENVQSTSYENKDNVGFVKPIQENVASSIGNNKGSSSSDVDTKTITKDLNSEESKPAIAISKGQRTEEFTECADEIESESEMDQRISLLSSSISGIISKATDDSSLCSIGRGAGSPEPNHNPRDGPQSPSSHVSTASFDYKSNKMQIKALSSDTCVSSFNSSRSFKSESESGIDHQMKRSSIEVHTSYKSANHYKVTYLGASTETNDSLTKGHSDGLSVRANKRNDFSTSVNASVIEEESDEGDFTTTDPLLQVKQILLQSGCLKTPTASMQYLSVPDPDEFVGFNLSMRSRSNSRGSTCNEYEPVTSHNITEEAFDASAQEKESPSESGSVSNSSEAESITGSGDRLTQNTGGCTGVGSENNNLRRNKNFSGLTIDVPDLWSSDDEEQKRSRFDDDFNSDDDKDEDRDEYDGDSDNDDDDDDDDDDDGSLGPLMSPGFAPSEFWTKAITDFEMKHGNLDQYTSMSSLTSTHSRQSSIGNLDQCTTSLTSLCNNTPRRSSSFKKSRSKRRGGSLRSSTESLHSASSYESLYSNHSLDVNDNLERPRLGSLSKSSGHSIPKLLVQSADSESDTESSRIGSNGQIGGSSLTRSGSSLSRSNISPISLENYNLNRYDKTTENDLDTLKMMTARMKLQTRRPSYQEWREEYIEKPLLVHLRQRKESCSLQDEGITDEKDRREEINKAIEWLRKELTDMKNLDQELARKLITIQHDIRHLKLTKSCDEHQELLDDVREELEDRENDRTSPLYEFPLLRINDTPLGQVGVTRMNLSRRRFSCC